jgi:hypothetical protein
MDSSLLLKKYLITSFNPGENDNFDIHKKIDHLLLYSFIFMTPNSDKHIFSMNSSLALHLVTTRHIFLFNTELLKMIVLYILV